MDQEVLYVPTGYFAITKSKVKKGKLYEVRQEMKHPNKEYYIYCTVGIFPSRKKAEEYLNEST